MAELAGNPSDDSGESGGSGQVALGVGLLVLLHLLMIPMSLAVGGLACQQNRSDSYCALVGLFPILAIGVSQLVYVIPAALIAFWRGSPNVAKGILIGAAVTFLLNAGCWGLVVGGTPGV